MNVVATSDLHGHLPPIPPCDLLIIAGDILPLGVERDWPAIHWLERNFAAWLEYVPAKRVVGIAGNHDFVIERRFHDVEDLALPWIYLQDSGVEIDGVKFWGIPWVPHLFSWAFFAKRDQLANRYGLIPDDTDVVISHGPPYKHLDNSHSHYGAVQANDMLARVKPKLFICGHVHEEYGSEHYLETDLYNVAHCDITYAPVNKPRVIDVG